MGSGISLLFMASCNDSEDKGTATVNVRLTDGPAAYSAVNIDIQKLKSALTEVGFRLTFLNRGFITFLILKTEQMLS